MLAPLAEQDVLVVAEDVAGAAFAEEGHDFVREAELVDGVAGAEEFVDVAHAVEGDAQCFMVAVDVGDDADLHRPQYRQREQRGARRRDQPISARSRRVTSSRGRAGSREAVGDALEGGVCGRGDVVEAAEEDDLAVEEVGLDGAVSTGQALPRRAAAADAAALGRGGARHRLAALGFLFVGRPLDAGGAVAGDRFFSEAAVQRARVIVGSAGGLDGVAEVAEELRVLPAHGVGQRLRGDAGGVDVGGDALDRGVHARRIAAGVEDAVDGRRVGDDDAGLEVRRGEPDHHGVHVGEAAEGEAFVLDAVLGADDGDVRASGGEQGVERGLRVLRLHAEDHDVIGAEVDLGRMADGGDLQFDGGVGGLEGEAALADGVEVGAAGDEGDVVAGLVEAGADGAADRARAVDDVAHVSRQSSVVGRQYGPCRHD